MSGVTEKELFVAVRLALDLGDIPTTEGDEIRELGLAALTELEARADERERVGFEWPQRTYDSALGVFGHGVSNRNGRTRKGLDRKIAHALRTWDDNYGPLNPEQAEYADVCLSSCFHPDWTLPQTYTRLDLVVHHDVVHAGFVRRATGGPLKLESVA